MSKRTIINHKWRCPKCSVLISEDCNECPLCEEKKRIEEIKQKREKVKYQIKNECASCGKKFQNNEEIYSKQGNFCSDCILKCGLKAKWRRIKNNKEYWENLLIKAELEGGEIQIGRGKYKETLTLFQIQKSIEEEEKKLNQLTEQIKDRWGIDMWEDDKEFNRLKSYFKVIFRKNL